MTTFDVGTSQSPKRSVSFNFGKNLRDAISKWGDDVVFAAFVKGSKTDLQKQIRKLLSSSKTADEQDRELGYLLNTWNPGKVYVAPESLLRDIQRYYGNRSPKEIGKILKETKT